MSVGIARISKGLFQRSIEQVVNSDVRLRYQFLLALQNRPGTVGEDWIDFLTQHGGLDRASASYIRGEWLRFWEPLGYAPEVVQEILRQSLIRAITLADQHQSNSTQPLPIACHWIWTDNNNDRVEVFVTYNEQQVTRILLTPPPPTELTLPLRFLSPYFIVKRDQDIMRDREQKIPDLSGYAASPSEVVTVQLMSVR
jgi:hypothetical protein